MAIRPELTFSFQRSGMERLDSRGSLDNCLQQGRAQTLASEPIVDLNVHQAENLPFRNAVGVAHHLFLPGAIILRTHREELILESKV
jgi:hypothetical protein